MRENSEHSLRIKAAQKVHVRSSPIADSVSLSVSKVFRCRDDYIRKLVKVATDFSKADNSFQIIETATKIN